jgi:5'-deoxynucleotidase YfbR-like HD superfamily hydrolase
LYLALRARGRATVVVQLPAHEIAYRELERLIADDLPGKGRIKEFYQRISDILRRYIENRFGLHAPEQTTEEFLAALGADATLAPSHKSLLKNFLQHCDLVKFARHEPTTEDIQKTFDSCRNFIGETKVDEGASQGELRERRAA